MRPCAAEHVNLKTCFGNSQLIMWILQRCTDPPMLCGSWPLPTENYGLSFARAFMKTQQMCTCHEFALNNILSEFFSCLGEEYIFCCLGVKGGSQLSSQIFYSLDLVHLIDQSC